MSIPAYPLKWPDGWPRSRGRKSGQFGKTEQRSNGGGSWKEKTDLTMADAMKRVKYELERLDVKVVDDSIVSTNLQLNLSGLPRGDQGEPSDPGVAVYFRKRNGPMRVIAIDAYTRVRDNLAAIAATLEAMRAIERHGGAQILERAFTGFAALTAPARIGGMCWRCGRMPHAPPSRPTSAAWRAIAIRIEAGAATPCPNSTRRAPPHCRRTREQRPAETKTPTLKD
jgi:hypothetical protein